MSLAAQAWQQRKEMHLLVFRDAWRWRCNSEPCGAELLLRWGDQ